MLANPVSSAGLSGCPTRTPPTCRELLTVRCEAEACRGVKLACAC